MQTTDNPENEPTGRTEPTTSTSFSMSSVTRAIKGHRKASAFVAISIAAVATVTPYIVQAAGDQSDKSKQSSNSIKVEAIQHSQSSADNLNGQTVPKRGQSEDSQTDNSNSTSVTVNGQPVEMPQNGSYSQTTTDNGNRTQVNITNNQGSVSASANSSGSSSSSSHVNISVQSESSSETSDDSSE